MPDAVSGETLGNYKPHDHGLQPENLHQDHHSNSGHESLLDDAMERREGIQMSPVQWRSHLELMRSFTEAAGQAASSREHTPVGGYTSAVLVAGNQPLNLNLPTVLPIPDVIPPDVEQELAKLEQVAPEVAPVEDKSVDSFYSLTDDVDQVVAKEGPSPIPEEEHVQPLVSPRESKSSDSFCSLASASTVSVTSAPILAVRKPGKHMKPFTTTVKPPNVLVYSESSVTLDNVTTVLHSTLQRDKYAIYPVSQSALLSSPWSDNTVLLVMCGNVAESLAARFLHYLLQGGRVLCLCSDFLHMVLPTFRTAEVRERELVQFSYARWKQVRMMHHIFCYQASPARTKFSPKEPRDNEPPAPSARAPQPPSSVQVMDKDNTSHTLHVQVLGAEETWHTPSLLLATETGSGGKVVFSQVHLEVDPTQYEDEETKFAALKHSNTARLEILQDLLSTHLGLQCSSKQSMPQYTPAYFLGRHETKLEFLKKLQGRLEADNMLKLSRISLQFCSAKGVEPPRATGTLMPILVHACPSNFSTIEYFENLQSEVIGRLLIYSEVMTSSMDVLAGSSLQHGLAVVPSCQLRGVGRGENVWLSPPGCAMFSLQLHIPLTSYLGQHTPLIQHIVALAVVSAICNLPGYQDLDLRLKWPNDIYAGRSAKLGGLVVNSRIESSVAVCDIGCGVNLDNETPTTCINDMIKQLNATSSDKLALLSREKLLALTFTQLEGLLHAVDAGQMHKVLDQYYSYWLHSDAEVTVVGPRGSTQEATVVGVDDFGFLRVRGQDGISFSVHPDGNSFDMLRGLVAPSVK
ncbi:hypothetical protein L9F63_021409 [Diploptera punctata]|uniref:BPL/LPL catalytic domain-containing protein n=1 Tax=Diploptera punctata TaxID=6984 RepID=A0AAD8EC06_DIPPU|nr:hypothetical protein L9F63_021409 [Diploptera punctata]